MAHRSFPPAAAFRHHFTGREGFEVVFFRALDGGGVRLEGHTAAVEDGVAWDVGYAIEIDARGRTRRARVTNRSLAGARELAIESDGEGHWRVDGAPSPALDGCFDLDLESSSVTNALPVRRLALAVGGEAEAPAAYVRAADLAVERLEQTYRRLEDDGEAERYHYRSPRFDYEDVLAYDRAGVVLGYPKIATREL